MGSLQKSRVEINEIKAERQRRGLTQQQVADMAHVSRRNYARYESGELTTPGSVHELLCIKLGLGMLTPKK